MKLTRIKRGDLKCSFLAVNLYPFISKLCSLARFFDFVDNSIVSLN